MYNLVTEVFHQEKNYHWISKDDSLSKFPARILICNFLASQNIVNNLPTALIISHSHYSKRTGPSKIYPEWPHMQGGCITC